MEPGITVDSAPARKSGRAVTTKSELATSLTRRGLLALCGLAMTNTGCSLFVMAGKMIMGDPTNDSAFEAYTKKDMAEEGKLVAVICTSPESIKLEFSALDVDLLTNVALRMRQHGIKIIPPHEVASWIDDNGGAIDLLDLGKTVEADYIVHIQVETFSYKEENSPNLFRGKSTGSIAVWELIPVDAPEEKPRTKKQAERKKAEELAKKKKQKEKEEKEKEKELAQKSDKKKSFKKDDVKVAEKFKGEVELKKIFSKGFSTVYPNHQPVSAESTSATTFRKRYLDKVAGEVAGSFCRQVTGSDI